MIKIDKLIYSNRRSIQIQISAVGELIVRAPKRSSESAIMRFVMQKQEWIEKHQSKIKQKVQSNCDIITNDSVLFFGKSYKISQTATKTISFDNNDSLCLIPQKVQNLSSYIKKMYQKMGMKYFHDRVEHWGKVMHNLPQVLRLTNAKTCWGTCNSKRVVSLNWRLLMVGADESDYVIVHELSHLTHMNHSKEFWKLVEKYIQNFRNIKSKLKKHDYLLNLYR